MAGSRETVAKAAALECMRSAHRHGRKCYLYAFSGPSQVHLCCANHWMKSPVGYVLTEPRH
jgi:uncharacterized protein with von Willebrand factor type A (vWA) domain